ncbi:hypothetical protein BN1708_014110 [Verticillium longisporum]|nr:hypothetical protein BN1708_014110 [Verticillium longisporum]
MALPSPEEKKGTYLEYSTLEWAIENRLTNGQPEGETSRVWNAILSKIYRIEDGYMTGPYMTGPEMLHEGGRAGLFTAHIAFNPMHEEKKFLVVECKAPGRETDDDLWAEAADQLARHLKSFKPRNRLYRAIANAKAVRFYELNDGNLVDFQNDGQILWLDRQCQSVMRKLLFFRDNHLF